MIEMRIPMQEEILQYFTSINHSQMKAKWNRRLSDSCIGSYLNTIPTAINITSNTNIPKGLISPKLINLQEEFEDDGQQQLTFLSNPSNAENTNLAIKTIFRRKSFGNCGVPLLNRSSYVKKVDGLFPVSIISQHVKLEEAEARRRQSQLNASNKTARASRQSRLSNSSINEEVTRTPKHSKTNNLGHDSYRGSLFAINNSNLLEGLSKSTSNLPEFSSGGQTFRNIPGSTPQKMSASSNNGSIHLIGINQQPSVSRQVSENNNGGESTLSRRAEKSKTTVKQLQSHSWQLNLPDDQQQAHYSSEYTPLNFSDVVTQEQQQLMTPRKPQKHPSICNSITLNPPNNSNNNNNNRSNQSIQNNNDFSHAINKTSNNLEIPNTNHTPMTSKLRQRIVGSHFGSQSQGSLLVFPSGYAPKQSSYGDQKDQGLQQSKYQQQQRLSNNPTNLNIKNPTNPQAQLQQQQQQQLRIRLQQAEDEGLSEQDILSQSQMSSARVLSSSEQQQQQQQFYYQDCRNSESGADCDSCFDLKEDDRSTGTIEDYKDIKMLEQKKQCHQKQVSLFDMDSNANGIGQTIQQPKHSHVTNYWRFLDSKLANSNAILSEIQTERRGQQLLLNQQQIHLPPLSRNKFPKMPSTAQENQTFITSSRSQYNLNPANISPGRKHHYVTNSQQSQTIADYSNNQLTTGKVLLLQEYYETRQKGGGVNNNMIQSPNKTKKQRRSLPENEGYSLYQNSGQHSLLRPTVSSSFSQLKNVTGNGEIKKKLKNKDFFNRKNIDNSSNSNNTSPLKQQQQQHHRLLLNINTTSTAASASFSKNTFTFSPQKKTNVALPEKIINTKGQFLQMQNSPLRKPSHRKTRSSVSKGRISKNIDSNNNNITNINYNDSSNINQE